MRVPVAWRQREVIRLDLVADAGPPETPTYGVGGLPQRTQLVAAEGAFVVVGAVPREADGVDAVVARRYRLDGIPEGDAVLVAAPRASVLSLAADAQGDRIWVAFTTQRDSARQTEARAVRADLGAVGPTLRVSAHREADDGPPVLAIEARDDGSASVFAATRPVHVSAAELARQEAAREGSGGAPSANPSVTARVFDLGAGAAPALRFEWRSEVSLALYSEGVSLSELPWSARWVSTPAGRLVATFVAEGLDDGNYLLSPLAPGATRVGPMSPVIGYRDGIVYAAHHGGDRTALEAVALGAGPDGGVGFVAGRARPLGDDRSATLGCSETQLTWGQTSVADARGQLDLGPLLGQRLVGRPLPTHTMRWSPEGLVAVDATHGLEQPRLMRWRCLGARLQRVDAAP